MTTLHQNILQTFLQTVDRQAGKTCALVKRQGRWEQVSWNEVARQILRTAAGLKKMGVRKGDRVALLAHTSLEWTIADCAILAAGGITVPIYCALTVDRIAYILKDSTPSIAIVQDERVAGLFTEAQRHDGVRQMTLVGIEPGAAPLLFADVARGVTDEEVAAIRQGIEGLGLEDTATYVYTSGTTGQLKGVVISHGNIAAEIEAGQQVFAFAPEEVGLACLPLAHVLGRMMQFYQLAQGTVTAYAESLEKLGENYLEVRPHYACVVPRMLEKIHERAGEALQRAAPRTRRFADWALRVGMAASALEQKRRPIPAGLALKRWFADHILLRRLRARLGGRIRIFICGGAKLPEETIRFLHAARIMVQEGYGLTETFAAVTVNRVDDYHFGTVGKPLPGVAVKLAPDGEVLIKGPIVFREYLHQPEATRSAFDNEGWFMSGDLGEYSRDGFLRITGRKKDMIITAGGKNVAPQMIESIMLSSPFISHFMVYGDARRFLTALVTLNRPEVERHLHCKGVKLGDGELISLHPAVRSLIAAHIEEQNRRLARYETIKRFAILEEEFSVATGELTPTMKVRREFTSSKYLDVLESLYRD